MQPDQKPKSDFEDWLSNADGLSRRAFLAGTAGVGLAGFAIAANPVKGQVISTPVEGLVTQEGRIPVASFQVPIYEARPAGAERYPVLKCSACTSTSKM
ncbi:MAG TPA: hypothetical protein VMG58_08240 [Candidatus Sulfotelmatobacter sp.]|nr:hypothetical protein [Candidatus Sulfotelmatobacter sp.]